MMSTSLNTVIKRAAAYSAGSAALGIGYASIIERNAFTVREATMDVLDPGASPLRVLHISDIHMRPGQRLKQAWLRELAQWQPDLVINTGDNLAHPKAVSSVVQSLGDLLSIPGLFVFGSNDYFGPRLKNPAKYLYKSHERKHGEPLPWQDLRAAFTERGWHDMPTPAARSRSAVSASRLPGWMIRICTGTDTTPSPACRTPWRHCDWA
ncbi:Conserved hypothetical protein (metallophospho esterase?) [Mycobacteroides abscessus]|nr:Conserved hypothetical protein (metallophospho esterase?) [Mycobacteroides abscessus]